MAKACNIIGSYLKTANRLLPVQCKHSQAINSRHIAHLATLPHQNKTARIPACKSMSLEIQSKRWYSDERDTPVQKEPALPDLMELPTSFYLTKGSLWDLGMVWFTKKFVIPDIDKGFDAQEFIDGATRAIEVVSRRLAAQEYNELEGLITPEALDILRTNIDRMTDEQRSRIPISADDIVKSYIAEINVQSDKDRNPPWFTIQITVIALSRKKQTLGPIEGTDSKG